MYFNALLKTKLCDIEPREHDGSNTVDVTFLTHTTPLQWATLLQAGGRLGTSVGSGHGLLRPAGRYSACRRQSPFHTPSSLTLSDESSRIHADVQGLGNVRPVRIAAPWPLLGTLGAGGCLHQNPRVNTSNSKMLRSLCEKKCPLCWGIRN